MHDRVLSQTKILLGEEIVTGKSRSCASYCRGKGPVEVQIFLWFFFVLLGNPDCSFREKAVELLACHFFIDSWCFKWVGICKVSLLEAGY